jgi:hypothetical protein
LGVSLNPRQFYFWGKKMKTYYYRIVKTACWPRQWKVEGIGLKFDNNPSNFFRTWGEAADKIERLDGILSDDSDNERQRD